MELRTGDMKLPGRKIVSRFLSIIIILAHFLIPALG
jgi:hypothetical protein